MPRRCGLLPLCCCCRCRVELAHCFRRAPARSTRHEQHEAPEHWPCSPAGRSRSPRQQSQRASQSARVPFPSFLRQGPRRHRTYSPARPGSLRTAAPASVPRASPPPSAALFAKPGARPGHGVVHRAPTFRKPSCRGGMSRTGPAGRGSCWRRRSDCGIVHASRHVRLTRVRRAHRCTSGDWGRSICSSSCAFLPGRPGWSWGLGMSVNFVSIVTFHSL